MLTGELRNQIDRIWDAFWTGGISNPLEVIEQITYLLFLRRLDELQTIEELKATRLKKPIERRIFPEGDDPRGRPYADLRWSRFKNFEAREMYTVVSEHVFPFLRSLGGEDSTYSHHMKDARFTIPTPALLAKVVDLIDHVPMEERNTNGDLYEYMLGKIATAGQNGQFRTPRHRWARASSHTVEDRGSSAILSTSVASVVLSPYDDDSSSKPSCEGWEPNRPFSRAACA
jgi:type I restriction enzyme M protein